MLESKQFPFCSEILRLLFSKARLLPLGAETSIDLARDLNDLRMQQFLWDDTLGHCALSMRDDKERKSRICRNLEDLICDLSTEITNTQRVKLLEGDQDLLLYMETVERLKSIKIAYGRSKIGPGRPKVVWHKAVRLIASLIVDALNKEGRKACGFGKRTTHGILLLKYIFELYDIKRDPGVFVEAMRAPRARSKKAGK